MQQAPVISWFDNGRLLALLLLLGTADVWMAYRAWKSCITGGISIMLLAGFEVHLLSSTIQHLLVHNSISNGCMHSH